MAEAGEAQSKERSSELESTIAAKEEEHAAAMAAKEDEAAKAIAEALKAKDEEHAAAMAAKEEEMKAKDEAHAAEIQAASAGSESTNAQLEELQGMIGGVPRGMFIKLKEAQKNRDLADRVRREKEEINALRERRAQEQKDRMDALRAKRERESATRGRTRGQILARRGGRGRRAGSLLSLIHI